MLSKTLTRLISILIALLLVSPEWVQAQGEKRAVNFGPDVGETIDRQERDRYGLFPAARNFHSAVIIQRSDGSYEAEITERKNGKTLVRTLPIDIQTLDALRDVMSGPKPSLESRFTEYQGQVVRLGTSNGPQLNGALNSASDDSITLVPDGEWTKREQPVVLPDTLNLSIDEISSLSIPRRTSPLHAFSLLTSAFLIFSYDRYESREWIDLNPLFIGIGAFATSYKGSLGLLKSVDIDIPWEGKSKKEKSAILSRLGTGQYRPGPSIKVSPWAGVFSPIMEAYGQAERVKRAPAWGGRVRLYKTPRSGYELCYGRTDWYLIASTYSPSYGKWTTKGMVEYFSGGLFIAFSRKRTVNPNISWGWGMTSTTHKYSTPYNSDPPNERFNHPSLYLSCGLEAPLSHFLSLECRLENVWEIKKGHHHGFQVGLVVGPNR